MLPILISCHTEFRLSSGLFSDMSIPYDETPSTTLFIKDSIMAFISNNWWNGDTVVTIANYSYIGDSHFRQNYIKVNTLDEYDQHNLIVKPSYSSKESDSVSISVIIDALKSTKGSLRIEIITVADPKQSILNKIIDYNANQIQKFVVPKFDYLGKATIIFSFMPDSLIPLAEYNSSYLGNISYSNKLVLDQELSEFEITSSLDSLSIKINLSDNDIIRYNLKNTPLTIIILDKQRQYIEIQGQIFELNNRLAHDLDLRQDKKYIDYTQAKRLVEKEINRIKNKKL